MPSRNDSKRRRSKTQVTGHVVNIRAAQTGAVELQQELTGTCKLLVSRLFIVFDALVSTRFRDIDFLDYQLEVWAFIDGHAGEAFLRDVVACHIAWT